MKSAHTFQDARVLRLVHADDSPASATIYVTKDRLRGGVVVRE